MAAVMMAVDPASDVEFVLESMRHFLLRTVETTADRVDEIFARHGADVEALVAELRSREYLRPDEARTIISVVRGYVRAPLAVLLPAFDAEETARVPTGPGDEPERADTQSEIPAPPTFGTLRSAEESADVDRDVGARARPPRARAPEVGDHVGRYRIESRIGARASTIVYRAFCPDTGQSSLLHVARPGRGGALLEWLERDGGALRGVRHPAVIGARDGGDVDGLAYYVTPLVLGLSLAELIEIGGAQRPAAIGRYAQTLIDGLAVAAESGVHHGRIHPGVVIVHGASGEASLDFRLEAECTPGADVHGFLAPEAVDSRGAPRPLGPWSSGEHVDMYGLGATLYCAAVGHAPFADTRAADRMRIRLGREPTPVDVLAPEFPPLLARFIARLVRRRPGDRFSRWDEAQDVLRKISVADRWVEQGEESR